MKSRKSQAKPATSALNGLAGSECRETNEPNFSRIYRIVFHELDSESTETQIKRKIIIIIII